MVFEVLILANKLEFYFVDVDVGKKWIKLLVD